MPPPMALGVPTAIFQVPGSAGPFQGKAETHFVGFAPTRGFDTPPDEVILGCGPWSAFYFSPSLTLVTLALKCLCGASRVSEHNSKTHRVRYRLQLSEGQTHSESVFWSRRHKIWSPCASVSPCINCISSCQLRLQQPKDTKDRTGCRAKGAEILLCSDRALQRPGTPGTSAAMTFPSLRSLPSS